MNTFNAKLGLMLFIIYLAFYAGFVGMVVFAQDVLQRTPLAGVNLAVWYGFSLIVVAFVLAIIYGLMARNESEDKPADKGGSK